MLLFVSSVLFVTAAATNLGISASRVSPVRGYSLRYQTPVEVLLFLSLILGVWTLIASYGMFAMACRRVSRFGALGTGGVGGAHVVHKSSQYA